MTRRKICFLLVIGVLVTVFILWLPTYVNQEPKECEGPSDASTFFDAEPGTRVTAIPFRYFKSCPGAEGSPETLQSQRQMSYIVAIFGRWALGGLFLLVLLLLGVGLLLRWVGKRLLKSFRANSRDLTGA